MTRLRWILSGALALVLAVGAFVAYSSKGYPVTDVSYHDGGVWVTSRTDGLLGRFNHQISQLDSALSPSSANQADFDVVQNGETILVHDRSGGKLHRVDPAEVSLADGAVDVPGTDKVVLGGQTAAILEPTTGRLWVRSADQITGLDLAKDQPTATVGAKSDVAAGLDGTVYAASADTGKLTTVHSDGSVRTHPLGRTVTEVHVTAVGAEPVVLADGGRVVLPDGHVVTVPGQPAGAVLQQPGPAADTVLVATDQLLAAVPLDGGQPQVLTDRGTGLPAAPVRLAGCVHAAWGGQPLYYRHCDGAPQQDPRPLTQAPSDASFVFRVNRDVIVLNELANGGLFDYDHAGENLGNWNDVKPRDQKVNQSQDPNQDNPTDKSHNHPPVARPDQYGVRPGEAAVLPVLENDGDLDGDIVVIRSTTSVPTSAGKLAIIRDGQALQFTAPTGATGTVQFRYTIDDGRGGQDSADVTLTLRPFPANTPPTPLPKGSRTTVDQGGTVTYRVLDDWRDADGDALALAGATAGPTDGTVRFTPDGAVTFVDGGHSTGRRTIALQVTDGNGPPVNGQLLVDVQPRGAPPVAQDDLVTAFTGRAVTIKPLLNDQDPAAGISTIAPLRLSSVSQAPTGTTVTPDYDTGTVSFTATQVNTYYLTYQVTAGASTASAHIRVDVRAAASTSAPVAVADTAVVRGSDPSQCDVLANDIDLDGDVLVVSDIDVPADAGLAVSVVAHRWLRLVATSAHAHQTAIRYTVSDGFHTDIGTVSVSTLPAVTDDQPPLPKDDPATVRAGDIVTVDVLANDTDPEGDTLSLDSTIVPGNTKGSWFVDGDQVRFQAPAQPGTATATYTVRDPEGKSATGQVRVTIVNPDPAKDQAPQPRTVDARVLTGTVTRIPVPLDDVDPDGDSVTLLGALDAPKLGRIVGQGPDYLEYQAYGTTGEDQFAYQVQDTLGKRGKGIVHVGVAPRPAGNLPPVAADDTYTVAPGATVRVPVLGNDSDPDGDALRLEPLDPVNPRLPAGAHLDGSRLVMRAGSHDGDTAAVQYAVEDGRGGRSTATVTLTSRTDANVPPVARDDAVTVFKPGSSTVDVDVLANDDDVDGTLGALRLEAVDVAGQPPAQVINRKLRVALTAVAREVPYRITDKHGASATAFVRVPAAGNQPPRLTNTAPLDVTAGRDQLVDLGKYITDPDGQVVRLTAAAGISSSPVPGLSVVEGSLTTLGLTLRATPDYHGPAMLAVQVTDSQTADDTAGHVATIPILVTVHAPGDVAPAFDCGGLTPEAGAPAATVDLRQCVPGITDAERKRLRFGGVSGGATGVDVKLQGAQLRVSADVRAVPGTKGAIRLTAGDGTASTPVTIPLEVRAAPLPRATDDVVSMKAGDTRTVDVLANDVNPFPGRPMHVVMATPTAGDVTAQVDADRVTVRVAPGFHGVATVAYRVRDASDLDARVADATIRLTVLDKPAAPGAPVLHSVGDATAQLSWGEPAGNGAPVLGYQVSGESGFTQDCAQTVCQLTGLTNGATYHFKVRARNSVDWGPWGPPSDPVTPDVQPDQPSPPLTTFGDGQVSLTWVAPRSPGTPIQQYEVDVSPSTGGTRRVTDTSLVWTGLTNGSGYAFRIRAYNKSGKPSEWSDYSAPEVPAGVPAVPDAPTAVPVNDGIGQQITVAWTAPDTNGAAISAYQLTVLKGGSTDRTVSLDGDATSTTVDVVNGTNYAFTLVAVNKAGPSKASAASAGVVAHGKPAQPQPPTVSDHDGGNVGYDHRASYTVDPPDDNGLAISRFEFSWSGGSVDYTSPAATGFVPGLNNGTTYRVTVRACNDMCGAWSGESAAVVPYGRPIAPNVSASKNGAKQITLSWSPNGTNGRPIDHIDVNVDGGGWASVGAGAGSRVVGDGYSQTHSIQARVVDSAGQQSDVNSGSATTDPPPPAVLTVSKGAPISITGCADRNACARIHLTADNFPANGSFLLTCDSEAPAGSPNFPNRTIHVDGNGHYDADLDLFYGYPGTHVWCDMNGVESNHYAWHTG